MSSHLHEAALEYARAGIPVFPVNRQKKPLCTNGHTDATTDTGQIDEWWYAWPDANVATVPGLSGWAVIDLDPPDGQDNWRALAEAHDAVAETLVETWTLRSPRGGLHLYFRGHLPPSVGKLAAHVDVRGDDSYVLLPPSETTDGVYTVEQDSDVALLPEWIAPALAALKREPVAARPGVELDLELNVARARRWLKQQPALREKSGADEAVYVRACKLRELGVSRETALALLDELLDITPRDERFPAFIERKVDNAYRYGQNGEGAYAGTVETFKQFAERNAHLAGGRDSEPDTGAGDGGRDKRSAFHFDDEAEQETTQEPTWLIPELIPDEATVVLVGASGSYKSFLAQEVALAVAAGQPTFGCAPVRGGPVFYAAHEGRAQVKKARRQAWKLARGIVGPIPDFYVGRAPMVADAEGCQEFIEQIGKRAGDRRPALIVIDTLAKCMVGLDEDRAKDAGIFVQFCDELKDTFRCPILVLHHTGKDAGKGGRGSSAYQAGFDTTLQIEDLDKEIRKVSRVVALKVVQHKDADEREAPWFFQGRPTGPSLAFFPISKGEYTVLASGQEAYSAQKVAGALRKIGAVGPGKAVGSHVLALEMTTREEDEGIDSLNGRVAAARARLNKLASGPLKGFSMKTDKETLWFLPGA
jgi:hypothetical protein